MFENDCVCCSYTFKHRLKQNLCGGCRQVLKKLKALPANDPYRDVAAEHIEDVTSAKLLPGSRRGGQVRYNAYAPRREGQFTKNWKWEGLLPSGALPDSWWDAEEKI